MTERTTKRVLQCCARGCTRKRKVSGKRIKRWYCDHHERTRHAEAQRRYTDRISGRVRCACGAAIVSRIGGQSRRTQCRRCELAGDPKARERYERKLISTKLAQLRRENRVRRLSGGVEVNGWNLSSGMYNLLVDRFGVEWVRAYCESLARRAA